VLITRINLPAAPFSAAIGAGVAFVADGTAGLVVVNFLPFDNEGQPPTVTLDTSDLDVDPGAPGVQAIEGTRILITADIGGEFGGRNVERLRNVELLRDGEVIRNDVSFPFDLAAFIPSLSTGAGEVTFAVRATDTGGNSATSAPLVIEIVPDTTAPQVAHVIPGAGARYLEGQQKVRVTFSEAMAAATLTVENVRLTRADDPGLPLAPLDVQIRRQGRDIQFTFPPLAIGDYQITLDASALTDLAGNPLGGADLVSSFSIIEVRDPGGDIDTALDLGVLSFDRLVDGEVASDADSTDTYTFTLDSFQTVMTAVTGATKDVSFELRADLDGDKMYDVTLNSAVAFGGDASFVKDLGPGTYQIVVRPHGVPNAAYTLMLAPEPIVLTDPDHDPGSTPPDARNLGTLSAPLTHREYVGAFDAADRYTFALDGVQRLTTAISGAANGVSVELQADLNGDGTPDLHLGGAVTSAGNAAFTWELGPGAHHILVKPFGATSTAAYTLTLTPAPIVLTDPANDPGGSVATARDLGTLAGSIHHVDYIGVFDTADVYRFAVAEEREITAVFSDLSQDVVAELYRDTDGDQDLEDSERLARANSSVPGDFNLISTVLAGEYFLRVLPLISTSSTSYAVSLTADQPSPAGLAQRPADAAPGAESGRLDGQGKNAGSSLATFAAAFSPPQQRLGDSQRRDFGFAAETGRPMPPLVFPEQPLDFFTGDLLVSFPRHAAAAARTFGAEAARREAAFSSPEFLDELAFLGKFGG
jgi:hypothetical protein